MPLGLFFGRLANFVNGELFGRPTDMPWGMIFPQHDNLPRHPSDPHQLGDLWLGVDEQSRIEIGVVGWNSALRTVLTEYRADAIGFVPRYLGEAPRGAEYDLRDRLVLTFNAEGLARAAARARADLGSGAGPPRLSQ